MALWASQVMLVVKNLPANAGAAGDTGSISGSGRSPGEGNGNPPQYSCGDNPTDRGDWRAAVHGVAKSQTRLKQFSSSSSSSSRASLVAQMVKNLSAMQETPFDPWVGKIPWRRKWQPTPVFLPGKSHGERSLAGYSPQQVTKVGFDLVTKPPPPKLALGILLFENYGILKDFFLFIVVQRIKYIF